MRRFGLLGYPLSHSFSQKYFTAKFEKEGIGDAVYENFALPQIEALHTILERQTDLCGLNVTIPYKKQVLAFLSGSTPAVRKMGACNCVKISHGKLFGYNTDVFGFKTSLQPFLRPHHKQALILGTGGASAAVEFVLQELNIGYRFVSRTDGERAIGYGELDASVLSSHHLIINTTPLGMYPKTEEYPDIPYQYITPAHHLYDLVYNPAETKFLSKGKAMGASIQNGEEMLVLQAEESWRIWNSID
jgi:shikimate dehydrogenase